MNDQSQHRQHHPWLGWIAMLACASFLSPISIHIVVAQEAPSIVVAPADPGEPPTPPQAPAAASEAPASEAPVSEAPAPAAAIVPPADEPAIVEPVPGITSAQTPKVPTPEVPVQPSEVSSDAEIGKLIPTDEPLAESAENKQTQSTESVRTLSVEPGTRPMLPEDRPAWVGAAPDFTSDQHFLYVGSLPTASSSDADKSLDEPLVATVRNYIDQEVVNQLGAASSMPVTAEFIRRNLIDNPEGYECELSTGQEPLYQKWVTVRITPEQRQLFRQWHTEAIQRSRLAPLGVGLVSVLSVISLSHVVLRRFRGASPLVTINQQLPAQVVNRKARTWSTSARLMLFLLLMSAVLFAFLMPLFALTIVGRESVHSHPTGRAIEIHDLHDHVRIDTLDDGERTIILESKSRR